MGDAPVQARVSFQVSRSYIAHSSLTMSLILKRGPASSTTTSIPRRVSSSAMVPPPAPEPMMTTTLASSRS